MQPRGCLALSTPLQPYSSMDPVTGLLAAAVVAAIAQIALVIVPKHN